ncbi:MAG: ABC transporter ATP-binding protein [Victivallales bacterium]|nr:ABC transporter ATP-binding protein [Victivallales bacterium]MCF7889035.1 ABC transporter ATP-binding protein [Victivallales bacterium]
MEQNKKEVEISLRGITKTYIMGEVKVPVLHGIDLDIYKSELTVILGSSGTGKSTLLNIIGGIDTATSGQYFFRDKDISSASDKELTKFRRDNIGFVFQFYNLVPTLTSKENVEVSTEISKDPMDPLESLELVEMKEKKDFFPSQMSGGQQQRISIARALAKKPALMLCDEPTGALDFKTGQQVIKTLNDLNEKLGTTIIIITHCAPLADMAHRVIHLGRGVVLDSKYNKTRRPPEEIVW